MASVASGIFGAGLPWNMVAIGAAVGAFTIMLDEWLKARKASWRPPVTQVTAALKAACVAAPLAIAFGTWLALLWHGPTDTLAGSPSGDLL